MKNTFVILSLLFSSLSFGQRPGGNMFSQNINELRKVDSINFEHIMHGYTKGYGGGYMLSFFTDSRFRLVLQTCMTHDSKDSGSWRILGDKLLLTNAASQTSAYNIYEVDSFLFFVPVNGKQQFLNELRKNLLKHKNSSPYNVNGIRFTPATLACLDVRRKYYGFWTQYH